MHTQVGLQALRVSLRDDTTMFCFTFRHDGDVPLGDVVAQQELLRRRLRDVGWEVREILTRMPEARTFYFDRASQILLDRAGGDHAAAFAACQLRDSRRSCGRNRMPPSGWESHSLPANARSC
jgi:hypothetical protein